MKGRTARSWPRPVGLLPGLLVGLALGLALGGCSRCSGDGGLRVGGDHPYLRCAAADPPSLGDPWQVGELSFALDGRRLRITREGSTVTRIAAFAGPASGGGAMDLSGVRAADPDLVLVLGGLGDTEAEAQRALVALATLELPVLFVAGGRDAPSAYRPAFEALGEEAKKRVINATTLYAIELGGEPGGRTLIPVAGAPLGRYARSEEACGLSADDLEAIGDVAGEGEGRLLLSWAAPTARGPRDVAVGLLGADAGSAEIAALMEQTGARGGIFAWPSEQAMRPTAGEADRWLPRGEASMSLRVVLPRIAGPALQRADGSLLPSGFALLRLDSEGLSVEPISEDGGEDEGDEEEAEGD